MRPAVREIASHDPAAEARAIGAAFRDPEAAALLVRELHPEDFFLDLHRTFFAGICRVVDAKEHVDLVTVCSTLKADGPPLAADLTRIVDETPTAAGLSAHIRILKEHSHRRTTLNAALRLAEQITKNDGSIEDHLKDFYEIVGEARTGESTEPFEMLPIEEFRRASFLGSRFLVESIGLTEGGVGLFTAPSGDGKSLFVLNAECAWAGADLPIAKALPAVRPLRILGFEVENAPGIERFRADKILGSAHGPGGLFLFTRNQPIQFSGSKGKPEEKALEQLRETLARFQPIDLVVLNPLVYLHEAAENDATEMMRWLKPLREVCRLAGAAILLVHHAGWVGDGEDSRGRGSTAIRAWSDFELSLKRQKKNGTLFRLNLVKANFVPAWKGALTLQLNDQTLRFEAVDETGMVCPPEALVEWLVGECGSEWKQSRRALHEAISQHFGCELRTAQEAFKRAKDLGLLTAEGQRGPIRVATSQGELL
jgi:hypothetical protein